MAMRYFLLVLVCLSALRLNAQSIQGDWRGRLESPQLALRVAIHLNNSSTLSGTIDILDQGMKGIPLGNPQANDTSFSFQLGAAKYNGRFVSTDSISGMWEQGGQLMPLDLGRGQWIIRRPQQPQPPFPYRVEDVSCQNAQAPGVTLSATITIPEGEGPFTGVVLVSGSGPNDRNEDILTHQPFAVLADYLTRRGIVVLRFDDRGVGKSTGKFPTATTHDFATDALACWEYLKGRRDLNIAQVGIVGHSEGGVIAPIAAVNNRLVDFIVLLAGTGVRGDQLLLRQQELVLASQGATEAEIDENERDNEKIFGIILKSKSIKKARKQLDKYLRRQMEERDTTLTDAQLKAVISAYNNVWMRNFIKLDPATFLRQVQCPVLAINGERDIQVSAEQNLPAIESALQEAGNKHFSIKRFPGLNHLFQHCVKCDVGEYGQLEETFAEEAMAFVADWILALPK